MMDVRKTTEIDWDKVLFDTKVLVSNDKKKWEEAYFAFIVPVYKRKEKYFAVFWSWSIDKSVCKSNADYVKCYKYCKFLESFEVSREWLRDDRYSKNDSRC